MNVVYLEREGKQFGPFALEEARRYISEGRFGADDLGWIEGMPEWRVLAQIPQLNFAPPPAAVAPVDAPRLASTSATPMYAGPMYPGNFANVGTAPTATHIQAEFATFWRRAAAFVIDALVASFISTILITVLILLFGLGYMVSKLGPVDDQTGTAIALLLIVAPCVLNIAYFAFWNCTQGMAPPGKLLFGLVVVNAEAKKIGFAQSLFREGLRLIGSIFFLATYFTQPLSARRQCLHDMFSGTVVLRKSSAAGLPAAGVWVVNVLAGLLLLVSVLAQLAQQSY
jgi:uncharacterized RDD family membrane protein YckC